MISSLMPWVQKLCKNIYRTDEGKVILFSGLLFPAPVSIVV